MKQNGELSEREKEVAALLLQGKSNKQIAQALGLSTRTIEFHISNIYAKLGVSSRAEAILKLSASDLWKTTGGPAGTVLREATVDKAGDPSENDAKHIFLNRRITVKNLLPYLFAAAAIFGIVLIVFGFFIFSGGGARNQLPTYTPVQPTYTPILDAQPQPAAPTHTAYVIPVEPSGDRVAYEGISFDLVPAVATGADGRFVPENPGSENDPYWDIHPDYFRIELTGYPLAETAHRPAVYVYPVEDYRRLSGDVGNTIDDLKEYLALKPFAVDKIPFLPVFNAGQVFHSNVEYLDFENGSGVRFLTLYAQYPAPINNQDLFYTFQGLTSDGRYYVAILLPVSHPSLPADGNAVSETEMDAILEDYNGYRTETAAALLSQPAGSFTPDLSAMDALVESLKIER